MDCCGGRAMQSGAIRGPMAGENPRLEDISGRGNRPSAAQEGEFATGEEEMGEERPSAGCLFSLRLGRGVAFIEISKGIAPSGPVSTALVPI